MAMSESTFNSYLAKILSARYGEEVRGSIHDSLQGMYEIVKGNVLDVTTAKQTIDTAAAAANSAASKANTAASNADTATSKANASATKADAAAAGANTAKDAANTAASKATTEAGKATTAATQANTAASSANSAASKANEAAGSANKATEAANTAKSEADKATTRANDAAAIIETLDVGDINTGEIATKRYVGEQIKNVDSENLYEGTEFFTGRNKWYNIDKWEYDGKLTMYNGFLVMKRTGSWNGLAQIIPTKKGDEYTLSFWAKVDVGGEIRSVPRNLKSDNTLVFEGFINNDGKEDIIVNTNNDASSWKYYTIHISITMDNINMLWKIENSNPDKTLYICGMKLERGHKTYTSWSPSPNDRFSGGTNLLPNGRITSDIFKNILYKSPTSNAEFVTMDGIECVHFHGNESGSANIAFTKLQNIPNEKMLPNEVYVASALVLLKNIVLHPENGEPYLTFYFTGTAENESDTWGGARYLKHNDHFFTYKCDKWTRMYSIFVPFSYHQNRGKYTNWEFKIHSEYISGDIYAQDFKIERGNFPSDWSPAPEDIEHAISRRAAVTYDYGRRNLKEIFGTPDKLHDALAAEDYSKIAVGDYWPITLNGTFWDYGEGDNYIERTFNDATVIFEVAGNEGELANKKPNITFISRDCIPFNLRIRKNKTKWEDESANNPWVGSALYKTLNDPDNGIIHLMMQTELGANIYNGSNDNGMSAMLESKSKDISNANGTVWCDRGKLFLPTVMEVFGYPFYADKNYESGLPNQFAIFRDSTRHISKGLGNNGLRTTWWMSSSRENSNTDFTCVNIFGNVRTNAADGIYSVPICFVFV